MAQKSSSSSSGGIGFFGALTILFVALKLTHVIDWSWWWVLAPIWIPLTIVVVILIGVLLFAVAVWIYENNFMSKEELNRRKLAKMLDRIVRK